MKPAGYSDLHNIWDEICVQNQTEQFTSWEGYDNTVRSLVYGFIEKLEDHEQVAIWLQTDAGFDWLWQLTENAEKENVSMPIDNKEEHVPMDIDDIVAYVTREYVYWQAGKWSNSRIRGF
jgi:hypothetical protein